jgi:hypothetical protein
MRRAGCSTRLCAEDGARHGVLQAEAVAVDGDGRQAGAGRVGGGNGVEQVGQIAARVRVHHAARRTSVPSAQHAGDTQAQQRKDQAARLSQAAKGKSKWRRGEARCTGSGSGRAPCSAVTALPSAVQWRHMAGRGSARWGEEGGGVNC